MNAIVPDSASAAPRQGLLTARDLVREGRLEAAMVIFRLHLKMQPLGDDLRSDLQVGLATALYLAAQAEPVADVALRKLDKARVLLETALKHRVRDADKLAWANCRANLASVHLASNARLGNPQSVLQAHLALDGTEAAFANDPAGLDWIKAMRSQLRDLRERR